MSFLFKPFQKDPLPPLAVRLQTASPEQRRRVQQLLLLCACAITAILTWATVTGGLALPVLMAVLAICGSGLVSKSVQSHERAGELWAYYGAKSLIPGIGLVDLLRGRPSRSAAQLQASEGWDQQAPAAKSATESVHGFSPRQRRKSRKANRHALNRKTGDE